jgi:hypothetical protein
MKALIDPQVGVQYTSSWKISTIPGETNYVRVMSDLAQSAVICDKKETQYDVAPPCFWVDCDDDLDIVNSYYDTSDSTIKAKPHAAVPTE